MGPKTRKMVELQQMLNGGKNNDAEREKKRQKDRINLGIMENREQGRRHRNWRRKVKG